MATSTLNGCCLKSSSSYGCKTHHGNKDKKTLDSRIRDRFIRTNIDLIVIGIILGLYHIRSAYASEEEATTHQGSEGTEEEIYEEEVSDVYAVFYPWFVEFVGIFMYYILSRFVHHLPYTAVMFIVGAFIGLAAERKIHEGPIEKSAASWLSIEGEVILLVFLPGLLYLDSYNIDIHLFFKSFWQLITFAFPMVLGGTALTACVAYFIFPYGWSFDLCMTFGAILSATDPVAVAVLLNELGAPPRLKMHISGESLLNDGSAVVFYHIFSSRFYYEMNLPGIGEDIGWGEGFLLFFRLSLGGMCIGIAFGVATVIGLYNFNRRLSGEDSVVQVVLTITSAYLTFFVSEILAGCSGIIAVMFCGVVVKTVGETMINDTELMHHFWEITEFLLNTLLFTLGGTVWGDIISNNSATVEVDPLFTLKDWGYLIVLYIMLMVIRYFLLAAFYPLISRIGIGTNWKEAVFMGWGGLRGAVGIALALTLHAETEHFSSATATELTADDQVVSNSQYTDYTSKLFGMVGGIALLTLVINGILSAPILQKLGLVTPTETRKKFIENYHQHMINYTMQEYVELLSDERFQNVDYTVIRAHVPYLKDISLDKFMSAVNEHKERTPAKEYRKPNLKHVVPYLYKDEERNGGLENGALENDSKSPTNAIDVKVIRRIRQKSIQDMRRDRTQRHTVFDLSAKVDEHVVHEERLVFLKILRSSYYKQIEHGELESRGFIAHSLFDSLDVDEDRATRGQSLNSWEALQVVSENWSRPAEYLRKRANELKQLFRGGKVAAAGGMDLFLVAIQVHQALAFIQAHKRAAKKFKKEFSDPSKKSLSAAEEIVLDESAAQIQLADNALSSLAKEDVKMIKSHYACQILLNRSAHYFSKLSTHGFMTQREANAFLEEIQVELRKLASCNEFSHGDEMTPESKMKRLSLIPPKMLADMNLEKETDKFRKSLEKQDVSGFFAQDPGGNW